MKTFAFLSLFFATNAAFAGSVRLVNDTPFLLTADILSADDTLLGKKEVKPQETLIWEGSWSGSTHSETPYTVAWFCKEGGKEFSVSYSVGEGAAAMASLGEGPKLCPLPKR
ncbi:MAG: hypothetical protein A2Y28_03825 [Chlamydiae bacterium GWC2_50_10]|nr:MAG: hypothetical protein A2Z85_00275 [Chlamydiae bacterium GWA2_50_15]OGN54638.1 MAG: hypothetical protein A2098_03885 [Chlamydiae bacterium GWF2_49_8]OGN54880.1 MAG: hypothetical protein A2Y28_03825 [Chlamydiae bacterium GWC2_50_10]OGN57330.1 MAG: hypothetical protein A3D18_02830 [Chlamydiae bacterium RIFCSPHIGHO2_02_FULL_49_29]OGN62813.1 MAG: hypothetical protein A3E26_01595 [Chlamydiae bacterium RIFCSPHIGHO2_12_FULL_49_32]OGN68467.1 MAG: hypothetical protein A3I15_01190 [Chlamydiae bact